MKILFVMTLFFFAASLGIVIAYIEMDYPMIMILTNISNTITMSILGYLVYLRIKNGGKN